MIENAKKKLQTTIEKLKQSSLLKWTIALIIVISALYWALPAILNKASRALVREDQLYKADLIVALGGDSRSNREKKAVELYHQGWGKKIVVSGVQYAWGIHTADAAKRYVMSLGVPASDVLDIRDAWNTRGEAQALDKLMATNKWHSAIIVTSAFHSRRALFTIERTVGDLQFCSAPVPPVAPEWQPDRWWLRRMDFGITMKEFFAWINTIVGGWE